MTKQETIQVLQSIEGRAVDFPYMTACDWVAIAAAKRHLENSLEVKDVDLEKEIKDYLDKEEFWNAEDNGKATECFARHFFELGLKAQQNISINVTNIDKVIEENGVDPNSKEAKMFKESYYVALEKLKAQKGE